ncbi:MAG: hypothetical protein NTX72_04050 [Candidatus Uhrbacteria bacterium]|nr:hypothetical protein [Candidatus Uhrbacteria bacterium]
MRKSLLFICLGVLVVLSMTAASYFVLTKFSPVDEIRRMTVAMSRLQTVTESGGFHWTVSDGGEDIFTTLYTSGPVRLADPTKLEHDTTFRAVFLSKSNQYKDLSGELRVKDDKTFLTYTPPGPTVQGINFDKAETWVSFAPGEFPSWGSLVPNLKIPIPFFSSQTPWTPDSMKRLRVMLALTDVFQVKFDGTEETLSGERTRVVDARFDTDALKSFLYDVIRAREDREPTDAERLNIDTIATDLANMSIRLWIGKNDHLLYRLQAIGGIPKEHSHELMPIDIRIGFSDFNKSFDMQEPASPISFASIYQSILHALPTSATVLGRLSVVLTQGSSIPDQTVQSATDPDGDGLDTILEGFFGTNPNKADTDGDGVNDGEEVKRGTNPRGKGSLFGFGLGK